MKVNITVFVLYFIFVSYASARWASEADLAFVINFNKDDLSIVQKLVSRYDEKVSQQLPTELQSIVDEAKTKASLEQKVDHVLAKIVKRFNYVGEWRTVEGPYYPRPLASIVQTGCGDSEYWLDPTNPNSYRLKYRADISNKHALVLRNNENSLKHLPELSAQQNQFSAEKTYTFIESEKRAVVTGSYIFKGDDALALVGLDRKLGKTKAEEILKHIVADYDETDIVNFDNRGSLDTYSYRDLDLKFDHTARFQVSKENGAYYMIPHAEVGYLLGHVQKNHVSDLYLGPKKIIRRKLTLNNIKTIDDLPPDCTDWRMMMKALQAIQKNLQKDLKDVESLHMISEVVQSRVYNSGNDYYPLKLERAFNCAKEAQTINPEDPLVYVGMISAT